MTHPPRRSGALLLAMLLTITATAQQPMPPEKQAETILAAGQKAYNDGNLPFAGERFREVIAKFGNTPSANAARYGLGLVYLNSPEQDFAKAIETLTPPANDGGFPDRAAALYQLAVSHRAVGLKELEKPDRKQAAEQRFNDAARFFGAARDVYAGKKDDESSARARCDVAEMQLRLNQVKEARGTCEPFVKDAPFAKLKARPLGLYYHGLACFLDRDHNAAGRSLNQLAPFTDPAFGLHARYLVGRVLHLGGENAEASVHYDGVLADYAKAKADATQALTQPDRFKNNPFEKARLESLAKGAAPEYVAGAAFHGACLNYEAGKFAEALGKFQAFAKDYPTAPLAPDAALRTGFCLVQLKQHDEAAKLLQPLPEKTPRLADQALFWLGKAQVGVALAADPANPADRDNKMKAALDTLRKAADRSNQLQQTDPDAKTRRHEMLFELGDALQLAKQYKDAAPVYEQLWNEQALPTRREEVLQRLTAALGSAGEFDRSNQRCEEFRRQFPQSVLTPAVAFRVAENSFARAVALVKEPNKAAELKQRYEDAANKYKDVAEKFPEFERVNYARFGLGVCQTQLGNLEAAVKAFEAIPAPDRNGELALASYLHADCLIRQAPTKAEDALAENQIREKLSAAAQLLDQFAMGNPKAAEAPAALLKLGHCVKRLGVTLADVQERNTTLYRARDTFDKLMKEYPQSPFAAQARLEQAKLKALFGDRGGAINDLRQFAQNAELQKSPVAPLAALHAATLHREEGRPADAAKVLEEARQRHTDELAKDPERAEWNPLLKYHHAVAIFETGKPADARKMFEEIVQQTQGKPITAEAALRSGQCRIAEGKKLMQDGVQARGQAGNDNNKKNAAEQQIQQGRTAIMESADTLMNRVEAFRATLPTHEARSRMCYDAAWAYRGLGEEEANVVRENLMKEALTKLPPGSPAPVIERGKVPLQRGEERAFGAYKKLIDEFPDTAMAVDARFELAELKAERGDHDDAAKLLKDALDKEPSDKPVSPDLTERIRLRLGASLYAKKDYVAAASQFEAITGNAKSPYLAQALYRAGEAYYTAGEFAKAVEKLTPFRDRGEFHNIGGVSDRAILLLGQALGGAKQWDASRQAYEVFFQRYGNSPFAVEARYGIAWALQTQGKFDEAIAAYGQVIAATQSETAAKAQLQIGQCRLAQKKYADAAAAFLVVPYTYDYPELSFAALLEAARAFAEDGKADQAEKVLRKVLKDAPKDSEWAKAAQERLGKLKK